MSGDLIYRFNRDTGRYSVYRTGEFGRYVTSFATLHAAEEFVLAAGCPDEVAEAEA